MFRLNLQFFAHHKGGGSTKNGRVPTRKDLVQNVQTVSMYWLAISYTHREAQRSIPA